MRALWALLVLLASCLSACGDDCGCAGPEPPGFEGHTVASVESLDAFLAMAAKDVASDGTLRQAAVKFVLEGFDGPSCQRHLLDANFYKLHDEWMIFRRLNGVEISGCGPPAVPQIGPFATVQAYYDALATQDLAAFGLRRLGDGRIYDCAFYERVIGTCFPSVKPQHYGTPRLGGGTLIYLPPDPHRAVPEAIWAFSLYRYNMLDAAGIARFMARLEPALPPAVRGKLRWLADDDAWERPLALQIRAGGGPLRDRMLLPEESTRPGAAIGYTGGFAAGIPRRIRADAAGMATFAALGTQDIALFDETPFEVGPVAAVITAHQQTPQAHLNLLTSSRGTPNGWAPALFLDPALQAAVDAATPIAIHVEPERVRWIPLTAAQYATWLERTGGTHTLEIEVAPLEGMATSVALDGRPLDVARADLATIGGKCVGTDVLVDALAQVQRPEGELEVVHAATPMCLTVAGFARQLPRIGVDLAALALDPRLADQRVRQLTLEGLAAYAIAHGGAPDALAFAAEFRAGLGADDPIARCIDNGGLGALIAETPADPAWLQQAVAAIEARFAALSPEQGLRFRSSSTVEDTASFHGAGLYESESGWRAGAKNGKRSLESAIARVWGSYWRLVAWDERTLAGVDQLAGRMAVLVHPRFDDEAELANGVGLATVRRTGKVGGKRGFDVVLQTNTQAGSLSVTNPPAGSLASPEILRITRIGGDDVRVQTTQSSDQVPVGERVLSDAQAAGLLRALEAAGRAWLEAEDRRLPAVLRPEAVMLDVEFRSMAAGWPRRADGAITPPQLVLKQLRPLSRRARVDVEALGWQAPGDFVAATRSVDAWVCQSEAFEVTVPRLVFDPAEALHGGGTRWLGAELRPRLRAIPGLPLTGLRADWIGVARGGSTVAVQGERQPLQLVVLGAFAVSVREGGAWTLQIAGQTLHGRGATCAWQTWVEAPDVWLASLFPKI